MSSLTHRDGIEHQRRALQALGNYAHGWQACDKHRVLHHPATRCYACVVDAEVSEERAERLIVRGED